MFPGTTNVAFLRWHFEKHDREETYTQVLTWKNNVRQQHENVNIGHWQLRGINPYWGLYEPSFM